MSDSKTFFIPESNNNDLAWLMNNNNGNTMWNNPIWALVFLAVLGNGNLFGGRNNTNANTDFVASQLGQAVSGNANAISNLATQLNCTEGQIQNSLNTMLSSINNVANTVGMSSQNVINSINAGNQTLLSQLQSCCCDLKTMVTNQGYENRLANAEQTNVITAAISNQTDVINQKFCALEQRELQNKIDSLNAQNSALLNQISNLNQTNQFASMIANAVNPINAAIANLSNVVNEIKCATPQTITIPANNGVYLNPCQATLLGINAYGFPYYRPTADTTPTTPTT